MSRVVVQEVAPSAARLTGSLRDIGYDFQTAVADLVDNCVAAGARHVDVELNYVAGGSYVLVSDDGVGMSSNQLLEALRFGSRRSYSRNELGRFGLGLKTGSFSQCRRLTVVSRHAKHQQRIHTRTLDLDDIERRDAWSVLVDERSDAVDRAVSILRQGPGTVVVWEKLDRVLPEKYAESGWGRRRLSSLAVKTSEHLSMVFHRFIAGLPDRDELILSVNGEKLRPWDPFAQSEPSTQVLSGQVFEIETDRGSSDVRVQGYVLPPRDQFSSPEEFERMSGPLKWNRQQGLYIYRADRLVQYGGWNGIRGIDEHTKLARMSIDFDTDLDEAFQINVAKMRVILPPSLKQMLERPIHEACVHADDAYRKAALDSGRDVRKPSSGADSVAAHEIGIALKAALLESSSFSAFGPALDIMRTRNPELAATLGL